MKMILSNLSKETKHLMIAIIALAIVFGFNDGKDVFSASSWLNNFITVLIISTLSLSTHFLFIKIGARAYGHNSNFQLFNLKAIKDLTPKLIKKSNVSNSIPYYGITYSLLFTLLSLGKVFIIPITTFGVSAKRIGNTYQNIRQFDIGVISFISLLGNVILLILFATMNLKIGVTVNTWLIIWNLLPLFSLPGAKILFSSRSLYLFTLAFYLSVVLLVTSIPSFWTILLTIIFSIAVLITYYYYAEYKIFLK